MSAPPNPDACRLLAAMERELEDLERGGVRWLNLPARPELVPAPAAAAQGGPAQAPDGGALLASGGRLEASAPHGDAPGATPPHPSALDSLESLRAHYQDCRNCKLSGTRTQVVFGVGSERPRLMFIGEGPGADEDQQGEPFVGRAGKLLTGLIRATGLVRDDVYITNVVKCRPPGNRNPEPDEVASCRPIMQRQIELLDPTLIVVLGNVPLKVLRPEAAGITRERGHVFTYQRWQVLPTFHPSYLLRNPAAIEACWQDFRKALQLAYPQT